MSRNHLRVVTIGPRGYLSGPFTDCRKRRKLVLGERMGPSSEVTKRRGTRTKAVLPVRLKGKDVSGVVFEDLVHTLDVTSAGVRLGSVRRELTVLDEITLFFRKRKLQFRVMWTKKMKGTSEFQVGLQAVTQERDAWGMGYAEVKLESAPELDAVASQASGAA